MIGILKMFYKGQNLNHILVDINTRNRWSASSRAYELFGDLLTDGDAERTSIPWCQLLVHNSELYPVVNVDWSDADWVNARAIASRNISVSETFDTRSKFKEMGIVISNPTTDNDTKSKIRFLDALSESKNRGSIRKACKIADISKRTYDQWMSKDFDFRDQVNEIAQGIIDDVETAMLDNAIDLGDFGAQKYFLDHKGSDRGYGKNAKSAEVVDDELDLSKLTIAEQQQLHELIVKATPLRIG